MCVEWTTQSEPVILSCMENALDTYNKSVNIQHSFHNLDSFINWFTVLKNEHPTGRPSIQSKLYANIDEYRWKLLFESSADRHRALLLQLKDSIIITTKWLQTRYHQISLSNIQYYYLILRHFGIPISRNKCRCSDCNSVLDPYGDHALICTRNQGIKAHHNKIQFS